METNAKSGGRRTIKPYTTTKVRYKSEEWYTERQKGIGGSEASSIAGLNPYSSAFSVYYRKVNGQKETDRQENEAMRQGTDFENYVRRRFCEETGKEVRTVRYMLKSKQHPFMLADIDGFIDAENAILECKTTVNRDRYTFEGNDYPMMYHVQCLHYMAVTGASRAYIAVLHFGTGFYIIQIDRGDVENEINSLIEIEQRFWEENVRKEIPPAPTGNETDKKIVTEMYPSGNSDAPAVSLEELSPKLGRLSRIKQEIADLEKEEDEIENELKLKMGEATEGVADGYKISWKESSTIRLDTAALKKEMPDIYGKYSKETKSRRFLFKQKG